MPRSSLAILLAVFLACFGCGYHFSASSPITLPRGVTNIFIHTVDNPTLENWIDAYLRSRFMDEFTRRAQVSWTDEAAAEAYVNLSIISYNVDTELSGVQDITLRERASVVIAAEFRSQADGSLLWSSGHVHAFETFEVGTSEVVAGQRAVEDAIRSIADMLGADY